MELDFAKMEGLGNDFIILDDRKEEIQKHVDYPALAKKLCSRHLGIGGDGLVLILKSMGYDAKYRIYNSDGSQAQMCGNGIRCFAKYLYENKMTGKRTIRVDTKAGIITPEVIVDDKDQVQSVRVDMGEPVLLCRNIPFESQDKEAIEASLMVGNKEYYITVVSMGNPHAVIFVDNLKKVDIEKIGPLIEAHERFPEKTNVEFVEVVNLNELKMKVWERGSGITLACGTGACACVVAGNLTGRTSKKVIVHLDGGDLAIHWDKATNHVFKMGPATLLFKGCISI